MGFSLPSLMVDGFTQLVDSGREVFYIFFSVAHQPLVGHGLLIIEVSRTRSDTPHSVGLLLKNDQPDAGNST